MDNVKAVLVYQTGIANVFVVNDFSKTDEGRCAKRLLQSDFRSCAMFAKGLLCAGWDVRTMACNLAGDITESEWTSNLDDQPFSDKFIKVGVSV